jgi:hypothetical protein
VICKTFKPHLRHARRCNGRWLRVLIATVCLLAACRGEGDKAGTAHSSSLTSDVSTRSQSPRKVTESNELQNTSWVLVSIRDVAGTTHTPTPTWRGGWPSVTYDQDGRLLQGQDGCNDFVREQTSDIVSWTAIGGCSALPEVPYNDLAGLLTYGSPQRTRDELTLTYGGLVGNLVLAAGPPSFSRPIGQLDPEVAGIWRREFGDRFADMERIVHELAAIRGLAYTLGLTEERRPIVGLQGTQEAVDRARAFLDANGYRHFAY